MNQMIKGKLESLSASAANQIPRALIPNPCRDGFFTRGRIFLYEWSAASQDILMKVIGTDAESALVIESCPDGLTFQVGKDHQFCYKPTDYNEDRRVAFCIAVLATLVAVHFASEGL